MALIDMTGETFGELTVVGRATAESRSQAMWLCRCSCGGEAIVYGSVLRKGDRKSCGCRDPRRNRAPAKPKPRLPNGRRWVAERDGMTALVSSAVDEAIVEFDTEAKSWRCSDCGFGRCDHVAAATRQLPLETALEIAGIVSATKPTRSLSGAAGGAKEGEEANQQALAAALAASAATRLTRAADHDAAYGGHCSEVTTRRMTDADRRRLAERRRRKRTGE